MLGKSCVAYSGGHNTSWLTAYPARLQDMQRVKTVRRTMLRLYPVTVKIVETLIFRRTLAESIRFLSAIQSSNGFITVTKKRKIGTSGRLIGAIGKVKTIKRDTEIRLLSFIPQSAARKFSDLPASTQLSVESKIEVNSTPSN
jgi:hypothetical protein